MYYFFPAGAAFAAAAGAAAGAAALGAAASSCFNWRVIVTDAIGILGEFNTSILSAMIFSTLIFSFSSRLVKSTSIDSFKYLGSVINFGEHPLATGGALSCDH